MICQCYYIGSKYPVLSLNEQIEKVKEIEEKFYGRPIVKAILCEILNSGEQYIQSNFKPL